MIWNKRKWHYYSKMSYRMFLFHLRDRDLHFLNTFVPTVLSLWWDLTNCCENNENANSLTCEVVSVFIPSNPWVTCWPCIWSSTVCACVVAHTFLYIYVHDVYVFVYVSLRKCAWNEASWSWGVHAESLSSRENGFNRGSQKRTYKDLLCVFCLHYINMLLFRS